jgi:hypothetical protein
VVKAAPGLEGKGERILSRSAAAIGFYVCGFQANGKSNI